jgi:uncharacterized membrane-anchored protein
MWTIFFILLSIILLGILPFSNLSPIVIQAFDYHIEISITLLVISSLIGIVLLFYLFYFLIFLKNIPKLLKKNYLEKQNHTDIMLLLDGFSALYQQDLVKAKSVMKKINCNHEQIKQLKPIFLLLSAQFNEMNNCADPIEETYQELLHFEDLKMIALKGLITVRVNNKRYYDAQVYAEKAFSIQPKTKWLLDYLIIIYNHLSLYNKAEQIIKQALKFSLIDKLLANDLLIKCYIAMAHQHISHCEASGAISSLEQALKLDDSNFEASTTLARIYAQDNNQKAAYKILLKTWKRSPSLRLAKAILALYQNLTIDKKIKLIEELIDYAPESMDGYLSLAEIYINENMVQSAREAMDRLLSRHAPNFEAIKLMAIIEAKSQNNCSTILNWLNKL